MGRTRRGGPKEGRRNHESLNSGHEILTGGGEEERRHDPPWEKDGKITPGRRRRGRENVNRGGNRGSQ